MRLLNEQFSVWLRTLCPPIPSPGYGGYTVHSVGDTLGLLQSPEPVLGRSAMTACRWGSAVATADLSAGRRGSVGDQLPLDARTVKSSRGLATYSTVALLTGSNPTVGPARRRDGCILPVSSRSFGLDLGETPPHHSMPSIQEEIAMHPHRFDRLTQILGNRLSRRTALRTGVGIGGLAVAGATRVAAAQEATPEASPVADCPPTTPEENKALARRHVELRFADDVDAYDELLTANYVHHRSLGPGEWDGPEEFKASVQRAQDAFDAADVTIETILSEGDLVALAWTAQLTHNGEYFGAPPTGGTATWESMHIYRIECGRIAETWSTGDSLGLFMQLGVITEDELTTVGTPTP